MNQVLVLTVCRLLLVLVELSFKIKFKLTSQNYQVN